MPELPSCLKQRRNAVEDLVSDLRSCSPAPENSAEVTNDKEIQLMCRLWNIQHSDVDSREATGSCKNEDQSCNEHLSNTVMPTTSKVTCFVANTSERKNERNSDRNANRIASDRNTRNRSNPESRNNSRGRIASSGPELSSPDSTNPRESSTSSPGRRTQTTSRSTEVEPPNHQLNATERKRRLLSSNSDRSKVQKKINHQAKRGLGHASCCDTCENCLHGSSTGKLGLPEAKSPCESFQTGNWSLKPLKSESLFSEYQCNHGTKHPKNPKETKSTRSYFKKDPLSLDKVLSKVSEAEEYDRKTEKRLKELAEKEKMLKQKIEMLEKKEKDGLELLKEADGMWHIMEQDYKRKLSDSQERQKILVAELQQVDRGIAKWRKNFNDLQMKLTEIAKCEKEIAEKKKQKESDAACLEAEIKTLKYRIEKSKKDTDAAKNSFDFTKVVNKKTLSNYASEISALQKQIIDERTNRRKKELEGEHFVKITREDLTNLSRLLLSKRLENEDLRTEHDDIVKQTELIKKTGEQFKEKTELKLKAIDAEIAKIEADIDNQSFKCLRCHRYTDTEAMRKLCADCPRCQFEADGNDFDCVCIEVKKKFLNNVFENMFTVLESQTQTLKGKAAAEAVLKCLKMSKNGKLDSETRMILKDFIVTTLKQNLDLTIVGGAIKTKCEMEPEVYKQLMRCINNIKPTSIAIENANKKQDSCSRWGGKCHCRLGPDNCICKIKSFSPPKRIYAKKEASRNKLKKADVQHAHVAVKNSTCNECDCSVDSQISKPANVNLKSSGSAHSEYSAYLRSKKTKKEVIDKSSSPITIKTNGEVKRIVDGSNVQPESLPNRSDTIPAEYYNKNELDALKIEEIHEEFQKLYSSITELIHSDFAKNTLDTITSLQRFFVDEVEKRGDKYIKILIEAVGMQDTQYLRGVYLKKTPSENYDVVFDKEFEIEYTKIISESMENVKTCTIDFSETSSGDFIFDIENTKAKDFITFKIVKTRSNQFKLYKYQIDDLDSLSLLVGESSKARKRPISFDKLLKDRAYSDCENPPKNAVSFMYVSIKLLCFCRKGFLLEPSVKLQITCSGHNGIVWDKVPKIRLLRHFLRPSMRSRKVYNLKWTRPDEVTVFLTTEDPNIIGEEGILEITDFEDITISLPKKNDKLISNIISPAMIMGVLNSKLLYDDKIQINTQ